MAVTDLYLAYSVASLSSGSVTIQPASGTIYSFKRGTITSYVPAVGIGFSHFTISMLGLSQLFYTVATGGNPVATTFQFAMLSFSEAGVNGTTTGGAYFTGNAIQFAAINNGTPLTIAYTNSYSGTYNVNFGYTLVGVSLT
jgi:hypothetical protein